MQHGANCSRTTAFPAANTVQEIGNIDAQLTPLNIKGERAKATALNALGARVLIRCFGSAERLRSKLFAAQRTKLVEQHATQVKQLTT